MASKLTKIIIKNMKKFLLAFKKYSFEYLKNIAPFIPFAIAMLTTAFFMLDCAYNKSTDQFYWLILYTIIVINYKAWISTVKHLIDKALEDEKNPRTER